VREDGKVVVDGRVVDGRVRELVGWEEVVLLEDLEPPGPSLIVSGETRCRMEVKLELASKVLVAPEYWPVEVVGYRGEVVGGRGEVVSGTAVPYTVQVRIHELRLGRKGIELVGKGRRTKIDIPGSWFGMSSPERKPE
jgi:hypothetical protein